MTHLLEREYQLTMTASIKGMSPSDILHKQSNKIDNNIV